MLNNIVNVEAKPLYKLTWCSVFGNGDIQMKFRNNDC